MLTILFIPCIRLHMRSEMCVTHLACARACAPFVGTMPKVFIVVVFLQALRPLGNLHNLALFTSLAYTLSTRMCLRCGRHFRCQQQLAVR